MKSSLAKPEGMISADGFLCETTELTTEWVSSRLGQGAGLDVAALWRCHELVGGSRIQI